MNGRVGESGIVAIVVANYFGHEHARVDGDRLIDDSALFGVVAHLNVARQREILAKGMADEAVVGQQAAQVRMSLEENAKQVEGLTFKPISADPNIGHRVDHGGSVVPAR